MWKINKIYSSVNIYIYIFYTVASWNVLGIMHIRSVVIKWLSRTVLKTSSADIIRMFRELEKLQLKIVCLMSHRTFNETCLNNDLLPTYTNIYMYIYIYIQIYIYVYIYTNIYIYIYMQQKLRLGNFLGRICSKFCCKIWLTRNYYARGVEILWVWPLLGLGSTMTKLLN